MDKREQIALLQSGDIDAWNRWRRENPGVEIDLQWAHLQRANLQRANLQGTYLREAVLQGAKLQRAKLQGANLLWAKLQEAELCETYLQGADLGGADLQGANLQRAKLKGANLQGADLREADMQGTSLEEADLREANLQGTSLKEANLQRANLQRANLQWANLQGAKYNNKTIWPKGFSPPDNAINVDEQPELEMPDDEPPEATPQPEPQPAPTAKSDERIVVLARNTWLLGGAVKMALSYMEANKPNDLDELKQFDASHAALTAFAEVLDRVQPEIVQLTETAGESDRIAQLEARIAKLEGQLAAAQDRIAQLETPAPSPPESLWRVAGRSIAEQAGPTLKPLVWLAAGAGVGWWLGPETVKSLGEILAALNK